jgi:osmotically-inducible protein OsmY
MIHMEENKMKTTNLRMLALIPLFLAGLGLACTKQRSTNDSSYKDDVQNALKQADLTDVTVSEDRDRNTITLGGTVHSDDAKRNAGDVAKAAAGTRVVANEISV